MGFWGVNHYDCFPRRVSLLLPPHCQRIEFLNNVSQLRNFSLHRLMKNDGAVTLAHIFIKKNIGKSMAYLFAELQVSC